MPRIIFRLDEPSMNMVHLTLAGYIITVMAGSPTSHHRTAMSLGQTLDTFWPLDSWIHEPFLNNFNMEYGTKCNIEGHC